MFYTKKHIIKACTSFSTCIATTSKKGILYLCITRVHLLNIKRKLSIFYILIIHLEKTFIYYSIYFFSWTRQEAIDYMQKYTANGESDIRTEIDRYITWPGQACSYKIGELKIRELRNRAAKELGE